MPINTDQIMIITALLAGILLIIGLALLIRRKKRYKPLLAPHLGNINAVIDTSILFEPVKISRGNDTGKFDSLVEPILGDPTLEELGFGDEVNWHQRRTPQPQKPTALKSNQPASTPVVNTPPVILVIHVMATEGRQFFGYELLQALLAADLHFGDMSIFHRYTTSADGKRSIAFSLASAVEPGVFDLNKMGAMVCPGLSLFMKARNPESSHKNFTLMLETANELAEDLGGELFDDKHQRMTEETLANYWKKI